MIPFVIDVDNVLCDGVYYPAPYMRKFSTRDGHGFQLLRESHLMIRPIIMSGENDISIIERAEKLDVPHILGVENKYDVLVNRVFNGTPSEYIAISDDISDKELLKNALICFCPNDAEYEIKTLVHCHPGGVVLSKNGGQGCFREAVNILLQDKLIQSKLPVFII